MSEVMKESEEGFTLLPNADFEENKARMLEQVEWLRQQIESGEIVCFLACGLHNNNDGWGLGGVPNGTNIGLLHNSLVKLHDVFHNGVDEAGVTEVGNWEGAAGEGMRAADDFDAEDRQH